MTLSCTLERAQNNNHLFQLKIWYFGVLKNDTVLKESRVQGSLSLSSLKAHVLTHRCLKSHAEYKWVKGFASIPLGSAFSPNLQKSFSLVNCCAYSLFHTALPSVCSQACTQHHNKWHLPKEVFLPPPRGLVLRQPANTTLLRHFNHGCPRHDGWATAADQHTASLLRELPQKKQPISIWSHTENVSLQHCRLHNFYYISRDRSSEINQGDESIFHMLKLVLTATGSHKTLLSIKEMDFLFRVWSKATRALLKQVMLKVLKHSASRFKPSSTTGNHRGV